MDFLYLNVITLLLCTEVSLCLKSGLAAGSGGGDGLTIGRIGYVAGSIDAGDAGAGRCSLGDDVSHLIGLDVWLEDV